MFCIRRSHAGEGSRKDSGVTEGRKLFSLAGREYGYKGKEIAEFLGKDPAAVTGYLRRSQVLRAKMEGLILRLDAVGKNSIIKSDPTPDHS
jgi:hypothetical protein